MRFLKTGEDMYYSLDNIIGLKISDINRITIFFKNYIGNLYIHKPEDCNFTIERILDNLLDRLTDDNLPIVEVEKIFKNKERGKRTSVFTPYNEDIIRLFKKGYNITEVADELNKINPNLLATYNFLYGYIKDKPFINRYIQCNSKRFGKNR